MSARARKADDLLRIARGARPKHEDPACITEACAMLLLNKASIIGSRTKVGRILGEMAEQIRNGKWRNEL